jgi:hypothetical protein
VKFSLTGFFQMTLKDFNEQILPIINLLFSTASLCFSVTGIISLFLVYYQILQTNKWQRLQSKFNFIDTADGARLEVEMDDALEALGVHLMAKMGTPLSDDEISLIKANLQATRAVNMFLNDMQNLCASYKFKLVDKKVFNSVHRGRVTWWYTIFAPYVTVRRVDYRDRNLWKDFEQVCKDLLGE